MSGALPAGWSEVPEPDAAPPQLPAGWSEVPETPQLPAGWSEVPEAPPALPTITVKPGPDLGAPPSPPGMVQLNPAQPPMLGGMTPPPPEMPTFGGAQIADAPVPTVGGSVPSLGDLFADPGEYYEPAPPEPEKQGFYPSIVSGLADAITQGNQLTSGKPFDPNFTPQPPRTFMGNVGYGISHSLPTLSAGLLGTLAGIPGGRLGMITGGAAGAGIGSFVQGLIPAYQEAVQQGLDHDAAVERALTTAGVQGGVGAIAGAVGGMPILKSLVGDLLLQTAVVQPGIGAAGRVGTALATGQPIPSVQELLEGVAQDVVGGAITVAPHTIYRSLQPRDLPNITVDPNAVTPQPPGPPRPPELTAPQLRTEGPTPPADVPVVPPAPSPPVPAGPQIRIPPTVVPPEPRPAPVPGQIVPAPPPAPAPVAEPPAPPVPVPPAPVQVPPAPAPAPAPVPAPVPPVPAPVPEPPPAPVVPVPPVPAPVPEPPPAPVVPTPDQPPAPTSKPDQPPAPVPTPDQPPVPAPTPAPAPVAPVQPSAPAPAPAPYVPGGEHPAVGYTGSGRGDQGSVYGPMSAGVPILGDGQYRAFTPEGAKQFGPNVTEHPLDFSNPLIIRSDDEWRALTRRAGWEYPNPSGQPKDVVLQQTQALKNLVMSEGHDGIVVNWDDSTPYDVDDKGRRIKTLREVFDQPQAVDYRTAAQTPQPQPVLRDKQQISDELTRVNRQLTAVRGQITRAKNAGQPVPPELIARRDELAKQIADLEREYAKAPAPVPSSGAVAAGPPAAGQVQPQTPPAAGVPPAPRSGSVSGQLPQPDTGQSIAGAAPDIAPASGRTPVETEPTPAQPATSETLPAAARTTTADALEPSTQQRNQQNVTAQPTDTTGRATDAVPVDEGTAAAAGRGDVGTAPVAADAARQGELDAAVRQRDKLQGTVDRLQAQPRLNDKQRTQLAVAETQLAKQNRKIDQLSRPAETPGALERRSRNMGGNAPKVPGLPKTAQDYLLDNGASPFQNIFSDAGYDPAAAVNYPIQRQITIAQDQIKREFDFAKVEIVGKTTANQVEFLDAMMNIYHGGQALMAITGRPHSAMGFGDVTLRLEPPPPPGKPLGSYNFVTKTLTLKGRYVTLGHEWAHAEDAHMIHQLNLPGGPPLASIIARTKGLNPTHSRQEAFAHVINTLMFDDAALAATQMGLEVRAAALDPHGNPTPDALRAQQDLETLKAGQSDLPAKSKYRIASEALDPTTGRKYWGTVYELLARSREAHLAWKAEANGIDPRGVVMPDQAYASETIRGLKEIYPHSDDRTAQMAAWDNYDAITEQEGVYGPRGAGSSDPGINLLLQVQKTPGWSGLSQGLKSSIAGLADWKKNLRSISPWDPSRPQDSERGLMGRAADVGRALVYTKGTLVEIAGERARSPEAKRLVNEIRDRMGPRYGSRRYTPEGFEEREHFYSHEMVRDYAASVRASKVDPDALTPQQLRQIDDALTSGNVTGLSDPEKLLVRGLRYQLNKAVQRLQGAGLDVAQIGQYRPRIWDTARMSSDQTGFTGKAQQLYKRMFDDEFAGSNDLAGGLDNKWRDLDVKVRRMAPQNVQDMMQDLRDNINRQRRIERQIQADPTKAATLMPQLQTLRTQAQQLAQQAHDPLGNWIAEKGADDWRMRLTEHGPHDFESTGPGGNFMKHRELPNYADQIMKDYLVHDFRVWAPQYFMGVGKAVAKAETWGANWEKLNDLINQAREARGPNGEPGLLTGDDLLIRKAVQRSVENGTPFEHRGIARTMNYIQSFGALTMLGRTPISVLSEFSVGAMAHNDLRVSFRNFANMLTQFRKTANARDVADLANWFGITSDVYTNAAMMDRYMNDFSGTPNLGRAMSTYYEISGMSWFTRNNERAAFETSHWLARTMAVRLQEATMGPLTQKDANTRSDAVAWFDEHGVPPQLRSEYADWLITHDTLADIDKTDTMAEVHRIVMTRATRRQVLRGSRVNTPMHAEHFLGRVPFQFLNYAYQFQKSILDPVMEQMHYAGRRAYGQSRAQGAGKFRANVAGSASGARFLTRFAGVVAAATAAQLLTTTLREFLFNQSGWEKHEKDGDTDTWLLGLAFQRTGVGGTLDPVAQLIAGLKYTADISSIMEGASVNYLTRNVMKLIGPWIKPETNTNTLRYEANQALWNLTAAPALAALGVGLGKIAGPMGWLAMPLISWGTSRDAGEWFAETVQGPKGAEPEPPEEGGKLKSLDAGPKMQEMRKMGEEEKGPAGGETGLGGLIPLGLLDDMALPIFQRVLAPMFQMAPSGLKQAVIAAGSAAVGYEWWMSGAETRGQPAPAEKTRH